MNTTKKIEFGLRSFSQSGGGMPVYDLREGVEVPDNLVDWEFPVLIADEKSGPIKVILQSF